MCTLQHQEKQTERPDGAAWRGKPLVQSSRTVWSSCRPPPPIESRGSELGQTVNFSERVQTRSPYTRGHGDDALYTSTACLGKKSTDCPEGQLPRKHGRLSDNRGYCKRTAPRDRSQTDPDPPFGHRRARCIARPTLQKRLHHGAEHANATRPPAPHPATYRIQCFGRLGRLPSPKAGEGSSPRATSRRRPGAEAHHARALLSLRKLVSSTVSATASRIM